MAGHAFTPITVGTMALTHRLVVSAHSGGGGSLLGTEDQFERHCAYWVARVDGGVEWVGGGPNFVRNPLIPGFEPTGVGANGPGLFRHPLYVERMGRFMERLHQAGGFGTVQLVLQGGMPSAPSTTLSGYADHRIPHALDTAEVAWLIREYGESAAMAAEAGADAIELHANHDDLLQWFLSPLTNRRQDSYGGSFENRRRFLREVVEAIRAQVGRPVTLGLRLNMDELIDGGYGLDGCQAVVAAFTADQTVDYFSLDIGDNWGGLSYIPPGFYDEGQWAPQCGQVKTATHLPVVYVGRVSRIETAERILAAGQADLVGFARATIADPELVVKSRRGAQSEVRPCIGVNECIDRRVVEGLEFACATNPHAGREWDGLTPTERPQSVLVIGGGPAGSELAGLAAERGHRVQLWERESELGGQLAVAALARMNEKYGEWIRWQGGRLERVGVAFHLAREATAESVLAIGADIVVVATGAVPRGVEVPGAELPFVTTAAGALTGAAALGRRVVLIAEDDRAAPLAVADHLAGAGHEVRVVFQTTAPSPLVGKYTIGAMLARLDEAGVTLISTARLVGIEQGTVHLAHSYSGRSFSLEDVDSVVLACGAVPDDGLYHALRTAHPRVHLLGDAFAPRRLVFATRQAFALAQLLP